MKRLLALTTLIILLFSYAVYAEVSDTTSPVITRVKPFDGGYLGNSDFDVMLKTYDRESDIERVTFKHGLCDSFEEQRDWRLFYRRGTKWTDNTDFDMYQNNDVVCFRYTVENEAGLTSTREGSFTIDTLTPNIAILLPFNEAGNTATLQVRVSDNYAHRMNCRLKIDGEFDQRFRATNGELMEVTTGELETGRHLAKVACVDKAGNKKTTQRTFDSVREE